MRGGSRPAVVILAREFSARSGYNRELHHQERSPESSESAKLHTYSLALRPSDGRSIDPFLCPLLHSPRELPSRDLILTNTPRIVRAATCHPSAIARIALVFRRRFA
jgi:hypothetical protein